MKFSEITFYPMLAGMLIGALPSFVTHGVKHGLFVMALSGLLWTTAILAAMYFTREKPDGQEKGS